MCRGKVMLGRRREHAEQPMRLVLDPGGEVERMGMAVWTGIAGNERPQAVDLDRVAGSVAEHAHELAGVGVEGVDAAIAEIADQEVAGKTPESFRCDRQAPGRVED